MFAKRIVLGLFLLFVVSELYSVSFGAWGAMTGKGKFFVNPILYSTFEPVAGLDLVSGYGFTDNFDLFVNLSTISYADSSFAWGGSWLMPRYDLGSLSILGYNILGVLVGYSTEFYGGLQYHTSLNFVPNFFIEVNAFGTYYASGSFSYGGIIAPVFKIVDMFAIYFETDLAMNGEELSYDFVPGIDLNFGSAGELSLGYKIISQTIGAWYFVAF
ncbi:MAG: hypothetical protein N2258_04785 [Brevinematales bacterium]|nr:hypothetical protein [Brevinematales bacterium]